MQDRAYHRELTRYRAGLLLAVVLTLVPAALVQWAGLSKTATLGWVMLLALAQIAVHFRCFLQVGVQRAERDNLYVLLFSLTIVLLMVGGSLLVFFDQMARM